MKTSTIRQWPNVGMMRAALSWCIAMCLGSTAEGSFLLAQRQAPPSPAAAPPPPVMGGNAAMVAYIEQTKQKLAQAAIAAVQKQNNDINAIIQTQKMNARSAIEREIPIAAAGDTQELAKDVAEENKELESALMKSEMEAKEAAEDLQSKTENAVNMSIARSIRDEEKETSQGAEYIAAHYTEIQAEADALANEAAGAANFSAQAADNSALWVKELPVEDAMEAATLSQAAQRSAGELRKKDGDVKRIAKLAGNMALNAMKDSEMAAALTEKAKQESIDAANQASQNALMLNTIRQEVKEASQRSLAVISALQ